MNLRLGMLYDIADNKKISCLNKTFSKSKKAMCATYNGESLIVLDNSVILSEAEETALLAEELGHLETGSLYSVEDYANPNRAININKAESRARRWAIKKLIPEDELNNAVARGIKEPWALAEYFEVPEDFMRKAIEYYQTREGGGYLGKGLSEVPINMP